MTKPYKTIHNGSKIIRFNLFESRTDFIIACLSLALLRSCIYNTDVAWQFFKGAFKQIKELDPSQRKAIKEDFDKCLQDLMKEVK